MRHRADWDLFWRFELMRRRFDPLDARRWKRDSQRELKALYPGQPLLLDSTAGLGDHTINLAEEGFVVEACDTSDAALEATRRACGDAGLDVPVFRAEWSKMERPGRYDLIFNDAIHWVYEEEEMAAAARGLFDALKPGGALVYFYADKSKPGEDVGVRQLASDWEYMQRPRIEWEHRDENAVASLTVRAERGDGFIDEEHHYHLREGDGALELHTLTMRHVYRWDWFHLTPLLADVGFVDIRSDHFVNVKGRTYAMNRAHKPLQ